MAGFMPGEWNNGQVQNPYGGGLLGGAGGGGGLLAGFGGRLPYALAAAGKAMGQMSRGQPVDLSQEMAQMQARKAQAKMSEALNNPEVMQNLDPRLRALLPNLPPEAAAGLLGRVLTRDPPDQSALHQRAIAGGLQPGTPQYQKFMLEGGAGGSNALRDKVDALVQSGVDPKTALGIAAGRYISSRHPVTGQAQLIDTATGRVVGSGSDAAIAEAAGGGDSRVSPDQTLYNRADQASGVEPGVKAGMADTLGQLPLVGEWFKFPEEVEARQAFSIATNDLLRAFSLNPRYPVAEVKRIEESIGIKPGVLTDPDALRSRMKESDRYLRRLLEDERAVATSESVPADQRKEAMVMVRNIERFLEAMGVPGEGAGSGGITREQALEELRRRGLL